MLNTSLCPVCTRMYKFICVHMSEHTHTNKHVHKHRHLENSFFLYERSPDAGVLGRHSVVGRENGAFKVTLSKQRKLENWHKDINLLFPH